MLDNVGYPDNVIKNHSFLPTGRFRGILKGRNMEDVVDDGHIPGDGRGAAGLDSGYFAYVASSCVMLNVHSHIFNHPIYSSS